MRTLFLIFFCLFYFVQILPSEEFDACPKSIEDVEEYARMLDFEGSPSAVVAGAVNVITGDYFESVEDLVTVGANPIKVTRYFSSGCKQVGELYDLWDLNLFSKVRYGESPRHFHASVCDGGVTVPFVGRKSDHSIHVNPKIYKGGVVNTVSPYLSGKHHVKNKVLRVSSAGNAKTFTLINAGGDSLHFEYNNPSKSTRFLSHTCCSNGCRFNYDYNKEHVSKVESKSKQGNSLGKIDVERSEDDYNKRVKIHSDDGREVTYHISQLIGRHRHHGHHRYGLTQVDTNFGSSVRYSYKYVSEHQREIMWKRDLPEGRSLKIDYYLSGTNEKKVKALYAPVGVDESLILTYQFAYGIHSAYVTDANGGKKRYFWDDEDRLTNICDRLDNKNYRVEKFYWGLKDTQDYTFLKARLILDHNNDPLVCKTYHYDDNGNITMESLSGNLSGTCLTPPHVDSKGNLFNNDCETYSKCYKFDSNKIVYESDGIQTVEYKYSNLTNLVSQKIVKDASGIKQRFFYDYDDTSALKFEIIDDGSSDDLQNLAGVTERQIKRFYNNAKGLPEVITEHYLDLATNTETLMKRTLNTYTKRGLIEKEAVYDSNDHFAYSKEWVYDCAGRILEETDPAGRKTKYAYDANGNKIFEQTPNETYYKAYTYDYSNRLIKEEQIFNDSTRLAKSYAYDLKGNRIRATDIYRNTTQFVYDAFDRVIERILPPIPDENGILYSPVEKIGYNELNHPIMKQDACGNVTKMTLNAYGKPSVIEHPDGSVDKVIYNLNGTVKKAIDATGVQTVFEYDCFQRKIKEEKFSPEGGLLSSRQWIYNTFRLLKEIDPEGIVTTYHYNGAGLLIAENRGTKKTCYVYDALGRQIEKRHMLDGDYRAEIVKLDILGQVLEERVEDSKGQLFLKKQYAYDTDGNRIQETMCTSTGDSTTSIQCNAQGQPIKVITPDGSETITIYRHDYQNEWGLFVPFEQVIDSQGNSTIKVLNTHDCLALEERRNSLNETMQKTRYYYNAKKNLTLRVEDNILDGKVTQTIKTAFEYDPEGNEIAIIEAQGEFFQKTTRKEYNSLKNISKLYKPDGVILDYQYDLLGRLSRLKSSDNSIDYAYTYDLNNNILKAEDWVHHRATLRSYDSNGSIRSEILDHGQKLDYDYDPIGRLKNVTFPDQSAIVYSYNAGYLIAVTRKKGQDLLSHRYEYDLSGKRSRVFLPNNLGEVVYRYDKCLRLIEVNSSFWHMQGEYDSCGNATMIKQSDPIGETAYQYGYDSLYQLVKEDGPERHLYRFDSIGNRVGKDEAHYANNSLNQLESQNGKHYKYDLNGNLITQTNGKNETSYVYDALGRLTEVCTSTQKTLYHYDPFHRRMSKTGYRIANGQWEETNTEQYLYQADKEVGAIDKQGNLFQFRAMGTGFKGDIGSYSLNGIGWQALCASPRLSRKRMHFA